jgi:hypothetical protein
MSLNFDGLNATSCVESEKETGVHPRIVDVEQLIELSIRGLGPMFDPESGQFCHRLVRTRSGLKREGLSPRYTVITLLGLCELEKAGRKSPFPISVLVDRLLENKEWPVLAGDFGLLLWLTAVSAPDRVSALLNRLTPGDLFSRYVDLRQGRTMELAWLLTGLSYAALTRQSGLPNVSDLATKTYKLLIQNQGPKGFFGHLNTSSSGVGRLRGWLGSFADQVYPILALTRFSEAFEQPEALQRALECGIGICRVQGPLGQWWWHYDSRAGKVASKYPVFSVHQEGMAPMVLFALADSTGKNFEEAIYRGLEWIGGANELRTDMRDFAHHLIWRRIHPVPAFSMKVDVALSHLRTHRSTSHRKMDILHECRPYELGWLLYAFGGKVRHSSAE